jgi:hypothetical protein
MSQFDDDVAKHYARQQDGLPPPVTPHKGYATLIEAWIAHKHWLSEERRLGRLPAPTPRALPDPPQEP